MKCSSVLASLCLSVAPALMAAELQTWSFSFHHLHHTVSLWDPDLGDFRVTDHGYGDVNGQFQAIDLDLDGRIGSGELRRLSFDLFGTVYPFDDPAMGWTGWLLFAPPRSLQFRMESYRSFFATGQSFGFSSPLGGSNIWAWTPETTTTVWNASSVLEPASAVLMLLGGLGLAAAGARRSLGKAEWS